MKSPARDAKQCLARAQGRGSKVAAPGNQARVMFLALGR